MFKAKKFWCILFESGPGPKQPFFVVNGLDDLVFDLLRNIKSTAANSDVGKYDAHEIVLYKLTKSIPVNPSNNLFQRIENMEDIQKFSIRVDDIATRLSGVFPDGVDERTLRFLIKLPQAPENSWPPLKRARLTSSKVPDWLQELHEKLWNRKDLYEELFRSVTLTLADYEKLQDSMAKLYPNRKEKDYRAGTDGLATKLAVLQFSNKHSATDHGADHITQPTHHDDDESDDDVDEEFCSLFPFSFEYLDLSSLHLQSPPPRMPLPLLIREEYTFLSRLLDDLPEGGNGSAVISGQPGTGKTAYLYYILIQSMLAGTRCLFQTVETEAHDTIYLIDSSVEVVNFWPDDEYIIAFFDADGPSSRPAHFLLNHHFVKIIATCSPNNAFQEWIEKPISPNWVSRRITTLWSPQELFLTGMFLAPPDLSYSWLRESTRYFGFNPRDCFHTPPSINEATARIGKNIKECSNNMCLEEFWRKTRSTKSISQSVFQLFPSVDDDERLLDAAQISAVSPWALTTSLEIYERSQTGASFQFYRIIKNTRNAGTLRGQMFQVQVLKHLGGLKGPEQFTIRRLTDSDTSQWMYPGPTASCCCPSAAFPQLLEGAVTQRKSVHLVPQERNFSALHSILYTPGDVLTVIYATVETERPVGVVSFQRIQSWLKRDSMLSHLQPSILGNHWRLIFVVPEQMASSFRIQKFEGDADSDGWFEKVDQYVLGINEDTLWARTSQLSSPTVFRESGLVGFYF
ncbi:uncharacterized protein LACBIDRAFT_318345 [Laccaria bicolor S238N-H82]|uniref:Predicted protein n=1 Tax=Laccaria bicolor (strain S238N-H82 / ATCC MYA-4686) TaxID=486041 RepID=B0D6I9_LACBS|nr:uncharacterized protein LACBIDRAFT_318345 [Laccaria bicolor S238N-H82]EDR09963.1 predicted protein [Laccaria bicolor S238N-H82]|eukprot:XP_001879348.1 predicted protein [Laccaria bicolor S238N-H82]